MKAVCGESRTYGLGSTGGHVKGTVGEATVINGSCIRVIRRILLLNR